MRTGSGKVCSGYCLLVVIFSRQSGNSAYEELVLEKADVHGSIELLPMTGNGSILDLCSLSRMEMASAVAAVA
jgi:hypothetical protein